MATKEVFVCDVPDCGKSFETLMALRGHQAYHAKVGMYQCEYCERSFTLPQGLGMHMKARHPSKWEPAPKPPEPPPAAELEEQMWQRVNDPPANGSGEVNEAIEAAFTPLAQRYQELQQRQLALQAEGEQVQKDLSELWGVLKAWGSASTLTAPATEGVQVAFQKAVSDTLRFKMEEWLENRRSNFTIHDVQRGLALSESTAATLVRDFRDAGKLRLVGKRGRAHSYVSTILAS
jgi:hypothetical protein